MVGSVRHTAPVSFVHNNYHFIRNFRSHRCTGGVLQIEDKHGFDSVVDELVFGVGALNQRPTGTTQSEDYRLHFQIEFTVRVTKQHFGLEDQMSHRQRCTTPQTWYSS